MKFKKKTKTFLTPLPYRRAFWKQLFCSLLVHTQGEVLVKLRRTAFNTVYKFKKKISLLKLQFKVSF